MADPSEITSGRLAKAALKIVGRLVLYAFLFGSLVLSMGGPGAGGS